MGNPQNYTLKQTKLEMGVYSVWNECAVTFSNKQGRLRHLWKKWSGRKMDLYWLWSVPYVCRLWHTTCLENNSLMQASMLFIFLLLNQQLSDLWKTVLVQSFRDLSLEIRCHHGFGYSRESDSPGRSKCIHLMSRNIGEEEEGAGSRCAFSRKNLKALNLTDPTASQPHNPGEVAFNPETFGRHFRSILSKVNLSVEKMHIAHLTEKLL